MPFSFDGRVGNYRDLDTGRITSRNTLLRIVDRDISSTERKIQTATKNLIAENLSLGNFQREMIALLKGSHIRSATLGAGGKDGLNNRILGATGRRLRQEYDALKNFVNQIERGELSEKQIIARAKSYARSAQIAFSTSELITRSANGALTAKRELDPDADHCDQCPQYDTNGEFVPIDQIVPLGVACECRARCRCRITYRFAPDFNPLQARSISEAVAQSSLNGTAIGLIQ